MTKGEKEVIKSTPRGPACLMLPYWIHMLQFEAAHFCPILPLTSPETMARHTTQVALEGSGTAVMACLLPGASSTELLLKTAKLAARDLRGDFFAVCVSPPRGLFFKPASSLDSDLTYASSFGANTVRLVSRDAAGAFLDFAKKAGVSTIFVARNALRPFSLPFSYLPYRELLRRGEGFRIEVVGLRPHP